LLANDVLINQASEGCEVLAAGGNRHLQFMCATLTSASAAVDSATPLRGSEQISCLGKQPCKHSSWRVQLCMHDKMMVLPLLL
jgi:hypothetical protein